MHLLGAQGRLGLAVCTSLGLLIGAHLYASHSTVGQRTALAALHPSMHFTGAGLLIGAMCLYAFWILETCTVG